MYEATEALAAPPAEIPVGIRWTHRDGVVAIYEAEIDPATPGRHEPADDRLGVRVLAWWRTGPKAADWTAEDVQDAIVAHEIGELVR